MTKAWSIEQVSTWLEGRSAVLFVAGERLAPEAVRLRAELLASAPGDARPALEALAGAPLRASSVAVAELLATHRQAGAVDLTGDGQWARAGAHPLVALVGYLDRGRCPSCPEPRFRADLAKALPAGGTCPTCRSLLRPNAVLADEVVDPRRRLEAEYLAARADGVVVVGGGAPSRALRNVLRSPLEEGAEVVWASEAEPPGQEAWLRGPPDATLPAVARVFAT